MDMDIDLLTERFDLALYVVMQSLGPKLISHMSFGLTPSQVFMLHFIRQTNRCTVSKLAEKMGVNPSAITVMLDRLDNHGYVVRTRDPKDRRVVVVQLTEAGDQALNEVIHLRKQIMQYCLAQLRSDELDSLVRALEKLANICGAMDIKSILRSRQKLEEST